MAHHNHDQKTAETREAQGADGALDERRDASSERTKSIEHEEEDPERWDGMS